MTKRKTQEEQGLITCDESEEAMEFEFEFEFILEIEVECGNASDVSSVGIVSVCAAVEVLSMVVVYVLGFRNVEGGGGVVWAVGVGGTRGCGCSRSGVGGAGSSCNFCNSRLFGVCVLSRVLSNVALDVLPFVFV